MLQKAKRRRVLASISGAANQGATGSNEESDDDSSDEEGNENE